VYVPLSLHPGQSTAPPKRNLRLVLPATKKTGKSEVRSQESEWKPDIQKKLKTKNANQELELYTINNK